jgi:hypothetical protein
MDKMGRSGGRKGIKSYGHCVGYGKRTSIGWLSDYIKYPAIKAFPRLVHDIHTWPEYELPSKVHSIARFTNRRRVFHGARLSQPSTVYDIISSDRVQILILLQDRKYTQIYCGRLQKNPVRR